MLDSSKPSVLMDVFYEEVISLLIRIRCFRSYSHYLHGIVPLNVLEKCVRRCDQRIRIFADKGDTVPFPDVRILCSSVMIYVGVKIGCYY